MGAGLKTVKRRAASALFTPRTLSLGAICLQSSAVAIMCVSTTSNCLREDYRSKTDESFPCLDYSECMLLSLHQRKRRFITRPRAPFWSQVRLAFGVIARDL